MSTRCGIGYDLHRLTEGRKLIVGGIELEFPKGPVGHSDGDVLAHALCDALLGAAGLGDRGEAKAWSTLSEDESSARGRAGRGGGKNSFEGQDERGRGCDWAGRSDRGAGSGDGQGRQLTLDSRESESGTTSDRARWRERGNEFSR